MDDVEFRKMDKDEFRKMELEKYKITVDFLKFEATTLWQIFNAFFIGNNIFVAIIFVLLKDNQHNHLLFLGIGIVGMLIAGLWLATFKRNAHWYSYRMIQAKAAEENLMKTVPENDWFLLNKDAKKFADGPEIKGLKNNTSGKWMIFTFMLIYGFAIFWALFHLLCDCGSIKN